MRRIARLATALGTALAVPGFCAGLTVELRSPIDPTGFTNDAADCRNTGPDSCRGLLFVDPGEAPPLRGAYVGLGVTNTDGVDFGDLWITLDGFFDEDLPGNLVRLAPGEAENPGDPPELWTGARRVGPLANGETKTVFFYLEVTDPAVPLPTGLEVRPEATVWDGPPFASPILPADPLLDACPVPGRMCRQPSGAVEIPFIYIDTIQSAANKILVVEPTPASPVVGGSVAVQVIGQTGQIGNVADYDRDGDLDGLMAISPAALAAWPADVFQLVATEVALSGSNACGLADCSCSADPPAPGECLFPRPDGMSPACEMRTAGTPGIAGPTCVVQVVTDDLEILSEDEAPKDYFALYIFQPIAPSPPQPVSPTAYISSGEQLKHNDATGLASCVDPGSGQIDPQTTGCCLDPDVVCTGEVIAGGPGRVPSDATTGLLVTHHDGDPSRIDLSWGVSCSASATGYAVYEGTLGLFHDHQVFQGLCDVPGTAVTGLVPGPGDHYYLVVPSSVMEEGSYGTDSFGAERPASLGACRPLQNLDPCP